MKKAIKTLVALVLALVLAASLSAAAWADGETGSQNGGTTTQNYQATVIVNGLENGETVNAYKLISYDENYNKLVIADGYRTYLKSKPGNATATDKDLAAWLANDGSSITAETLEGYLASENNGLPAAKTYPADANGTATLADLAPGYYLLTVTTTLQISNLYRPMSAFIYPQGDKLYIEVGDKFASPQTSASLDAKSERGPTIEKKVKTVTSNDWGDTATAGVGDTAEFYVKIDIPRYPAGSKISMELTDTLENMTYNSTEGAKLYSKFEHGTFSGEIEDAFTVNTNNTNNGLNFMLDYGKIMGNDQSAKTVYLYYKATVDKAAANGGSAKNSAELTYANIGTPAMKRTTNPSSVTVYNYAFKLEKKDILSRPLSGAEFTICTDKACNNAISFAKTSTDGVYEKCDATATNAVTKIPADFTVKGLAPGEYYVKEIKTAHGYFLPFDSFTLTLTAAKEGGSQKYSGMLDNTSTFINIDDKDKNLIPENGVSVTGNTLTVQLKNSVIPTLPTTGGAGTAVFTVAGVAVMVLAAVLFLRRKKEEE